MTALGNECPKDEKISHSICACAFIFLSNNSVLTAACCRAGVEKFSIKSYCFRIGRPLGLRCSDSTLPLRTEVVTHSK